VIIFGSVLIKKKKPNQIFFKKNRNRFKPTGFGSVRFFEQKPVQTGLARFFCLGSVRFFFLFQAYKTEPVGFFKILIGLIGFFSRFGFFGYFFSGFLGLIDFFIFFSPIDLGRFLLEKSYL